MPLARDGDFKLAHDLALIPLLSGGDGYFTWNKCSSSAKNNQSGEYVYPPSCRQESVVV